MAVVKNKSGSENQEYWSHVEEVAKQVEKWPEWMGNRSDENANEDDAHGTECEDDGHPPK